MQRHTGVMVRFISQFSSHVSVQVWCYGKKTPNSSWITGMFIGNCPFSIHIPYNAGSMMTLPYPHLSLRCCCWPEPEFCPNKWLKGHRYLFQLWHFICARHSVAHSHANQLVVLTLANVAYGLQLKVSGWNSGLWTLFSHCVHQLAHCVVCAAPDQNTQTITAPILNLCNGISVYQFLVTYWLTYMATTIYIYSIIWCLNFSSSAKSTC